MEKTYKWRTQTEEERLSDLTLNRDGSIILAGTSAKELGKRTEDCKVGRINSKSADRKNRISRFIPTQYQIMLCGDRL